MPHTPGRAVPYARMKPITRQSSLGLLSLLAACASTQSADADGSMSVQPGYELVLTSDVQWDQLNPARGDQSPRAGTLWGDRNGLEATGFLFNPVDGFESPPHIHNVTYRGVVISGLVHNDDPTAGPMWMPARSFWTQPKGRVHITSAKGPDTVAYIEIDQGPYLVMPPEEKFEPVAEPINIHDTNLVWVAPPSPKAPKGVLVAYLWEHRGSRKMGGTLVKLPAGVAASLHGHGPTLRAVVIQGEPHYSAQDQRGRVTLTPGTYFSSTGAAVHHLANESDGDMIVYVRTPGAVDLRH